MDIEKLVTMIGKSTIYVQNAEVSRRQWMEAFGELERLARLGASKETKSCRTCRGICPNCNADVFEEKIT